jgi:hypothetical protein
MHNAHYSTNTAIGHRAETVICIKYAIRYKNGMNGLNVSL